VVLEVELPAVNDEETYKYKRKIGSGSFGDAYLVTASDGTDYVLKEINFGGQISQEEKNYAL